MIGRCVWQRVVVGELFLQLKKIVVFLFLICRVLFNTRQCPKKVLGKELFADKMFVECKMAFAECLRHSTKNASSVVSN
jgi:hypothetical protein